MLSSIQIHSSHTQFKQSCYYISMYIILYYICSCYPHRKNNDKLTWCSSGRTTIEGCVVAQLRLHVIGPQAGFRGEEQLCWSAVWGGAFTLQTGTTTLLILSIEQTTGEEQLEHIDRKNRLNKGSNFRFWGLPTHLWSSPTLSHLIQIMKVLEYFYQVWLFRCGKTLGPEWNTLG